MSPVSCDRDNREVVAAAGLEPCDPKPTPFSVKKLRKLCDPFKSSVWVDEPLTWRGVTAALDEGRLLATSWDTSKEPWTRAQHEERVAYLVLHRDETPIQVDVGVPSLGYEASWPVEDGNHRLAAAIYRGDKTILADASGEVRLIQRLQVQAEPP